jgi:hypothetical protein
VGTEIGRCLARQGRAVGNFTGGHEEDIAKFKVTQLVTRDRNGKVVGEPVILYQVDAPSPFWPRR